MEFDYNYSLDDLLDTSSVPDLETTLPGKSSDDLKIQINNDLPESNDISNNQFQNQEAWVNQFLNSITLGGINSSTDTAEVLDNIVAQCATINDAGTEDVSVKSPDSTNLSVSAKSRKRKASGTSSSACSTGSRGCTSKNAIAARENRLKKKKYVEDLENRNKQLEKENQLVIDQADKREERIRELEMRNAYLENVIRNQSTLSSLLGNLEPVSGVRLSIASQGGRKKQRRGHDGTTNEVIPTMSNGVCLHVDGQTASLELCSHCAVMAKGGSP